MDCVLLPLHSVCAHRQPRSGVLAIDSHSTLQYLPDVATHEQTGCAHFSAFAGATPSFNFGSRAHDPSLDISHQDRVFLYGKEHIAKAAAYAGGTGLNGAILRILKKARPHAQVTFIALPWIKVAPRRVSARRFKGTWRQGQLPSGQTAKARSDHRVQSLRMGHGRHRFLRIQLRC